MSIITDLIPGGQLLDALGKVIDRVIPDATANAAAKNALTIAQQNGSLQLDLANLQVNLADAQSSSKFQSWWRPALAWVCLFDVFYETLLYPVLANYARVVSVNDIAITMPILLVLIGARSADKFNGVATK